MLPISYVLKSLKRRKLRAGMTIAGVALAIGLYAAMGAVGDAMTSAFHSTGAPTEVVVFQAGSPSVEFSTVPRAARTYLQTLGGVASSGGEPVVSAELYLRSLARVHGQERDLTVRGVSAFAPLANSQAKLVEGRWPLGDHTATVGEALARRLGLTVGDRVDLEGGRFEVVGLLASGGRVYDREIWVDLNALAAETRRTVFSSFTLKATDEQAAAALVKTINAQRRFPLTAMAAPAFYARAGAMASAMAGLGRFVAIVIVLGAIFAGMNAMYGAVAGRRREIGVLRALGYRRASVLTAFLLESLALSALGGALGIGLGALVSLIPLDLPYALTDHVAIGAHQVLGAAVLAALVGVVGGLLPAWQASRLEVVDAIR